MKKSNEKGKINMKKMIAFLLAAVMLLSLAACGGGDKPANSESGTTPSGTGETTGNATEKDSAPQGAPAEIKPAEDGVLTIGLGNASPKMNPEKRLSWLRVTSSRSTSIWMRMRIM